MMSQILLILRMLEGVRAKNLEATILFFDFAKAFDSIHRGKMEEILLAYSLPKETVAVIIVLYTNTKVKVRSPDKDTDYFDMVACIRTAAGIGFHINAHKTEYMCFNQTGDLSTLNGSFLKLVDKFTGLESSVSSTETDINTKLTKVWTTIDRLSVIWKSNLTDKMKRNILQAAVVLILLYRCTTWPQIKRMEKRLDGN